MASKLRFALYVWQAASAIPEVFEIEPVEGWGPTEYGKLYV